MPSSARSPLVQIKPRGGALALGIAFAALAGCSSAASLDTTNRPLSPAEAAIVSRKSDKALADKEYELAWNHEVYAGKNRERLEAVALAALEADAGVADDMLSQLKKAHGGLTDAGRARVKAATVKAQGAGNWERAAEIQVVAADDAPSYKAAWAVYAEAPAKDALSILKYIEKARTEFSEAGKKPGE